MNNPKITLEVIQEQYTKFGILNKEQQKWLIDTLEMMIGKDPQFLPVIVCGLKQSNIASANGSVQSTPAWHILPTNVPPINISELLSTLAVTIAFRIGVTTGQNQSGKKSKIIKPS